MFCLLTTYIHTLHTLSLELHTLETSRRFTFCCFRSCRTRLCRRSLHSSVVWKGQLTSYSL